MNRKSLLPLAVVTAAFGLPAAADAASLGYEGNALVYRAAAGEANSVTLNATTDGRVAIGETGAALAFPSGCEQANESMPVVCDVGPVDVLRFELGDGADRASIQDISVSGGVIAVNGGDGNDALEGGPGAAATLDGGAGDDAIRSQESADVLLGGPGADELIGGGGDDRLHGGDGDDTLQPDRYTTGNDLVDGGPGIDKLQDYSDPTKSPQPVNVTLDGQANDGRPGERDDVRDVEHVRTYAGGTFVMGEGPDRVEVYTPSDQGPATVQGRGGSDVLLAGAGRQTLDGGAGDDRIEGGFGDDVLTGGPGRDVIAADFTGSQCGWLQSCTIPHGNDTVNARDGEADSIDCGVGEDTAVVDAVDTVSNCEKVDSNGPGSDVVVPGAGCRVPKVRGLKLKAARKRLARRGCTPVSVKRAKSRKVKRGRVVSAVKRQGRVVVTVSRGRR
jgi:RTX calcium-binding nonapeptide repeat (4 copies)